MAAVPLLCDTGAAPDVEGMTEEKMAEMMEEFKRQSMQLVDANPLPQPRFLAMFDELMEYVFFD